ncbi:MAG: hypothetical protein IPO21_14335 [Bacteroidales bacterium]|nr:hypothetical protein [Bacteroidales bacterium]
MKKLFIISFLMFALTSLFAIPKETHEPVQSDNVEMYQVDEMNISTFEAVTFSYQLNVVKNESLFGSNCLYVTQNEEIYTYTTTLRAEKFNKHDYGLTSKDSIIIKLSAKENKYDKYGLGSGGLPYKCNRIVTI